MNEFRCDELIDECREDLLDEIALPSTAGDPVQIAAAIDAWLGQRGIASPLRDRLLVTMLDEIAGYGPITPLLNDPRVREVMVNAPDSVWCEVDGRLEQTTVRFRDAEHIRVVIDRLLLASGRHLDDATPTVNARLADGSRLNAVLPPISAGTPLLTIRRFPQRLQMKELLRAGALSKQMAAFLHAAVVGRCNVLVSGGAGAGKTTLLSALAALCPHDQRLVTIEDVHELEISHPHVVHQECRRTISDVAEDVTMRDLVSNSLRMRPDRLVVGEVRGGEAADMISAMNTGHSGCMTTVHANSGKDALQRLEILLATVWPSLPHDLLSQWIGAAFDVIVHCERDSNGQRYVQSIAAIDQDDGAAPTVTTLFERRGSDHRFYAMGQTPQRCYERMARYGVEVPPAIFSVTTAA